MSADNLPDGGIPPEWRDEWTRDLARPRAADSARTTEVMLVFCLGPELFAVSVTSVLKVTPVPRIHRVPARAATIGVVNVRGRVTVCASLRPFLLPAEKPDPADPRLVVLQAGGWQFATPVDAVEGVHRLDLEELGPPPPPAEGLRFVTGLWTLAGRTVARLDEDALFTAVKESLA